MEGRRWMETRRWESLVVEGWGDLDVLEDLPPPTSVSGSTDLIHSRVGDITPHVLVVIYVRSCWSNISLKRASF